MALPEPLIINKYRHHLALASPYPLFTSYIRHANLVIQYLRSLNGRLWGINNNYSYQILIFR